MRGKYSPTITAAYMADQEWWPKYSREAESWTQYEYEYDPEGYDCYGYNKDDVDRAGNEEHVYYENNNPDANGEDYNWAYEAALDAWGFDGTKPVRK
jgi:hypothetical protein